jgi:hypothetical protein
LIYNLADACTIRCRFAFYEINSDEWHGGTSALLAVCWLA